MKTTDNNRGAFQVPDEHRENLLSIGNHNVRYLCEQNPDLLIFPESLGEYRDDVEKSPVFSLQDNNLTTYNTMGFVGRNKTQLTISSRFANDKHDYFLHYMLRKVFSINIFKFDQTSDRENIWDFLLYLFPYYLKKAYSQGLYKAYKREEYNDANVKGAIDVNRYIRVNIPFRGKVAYTTREHSCNNTLTQLIRHTIEHIRTHYFGNGVLTGDSETRDIVSQFCFVTQNSYNENARQKIISANLKPVSHPYFTEYRVLQKICLRILQHQKLTFGEENNKIYGLLFDGAWLWEEYLNTFIGGNFRHLYNKKGEGYQLFETGEGKICPDFVDEKSKIIVDAKYKPIENIKGDDYLQILAYMFRFNSEKGFFIYPSKTLNNKKEMKLKDNDDIYVYKSGLQIPQNADSFTDFQGAMRINERSLREAV